MSGAIAIPVLAAAQQRSPLDMPAWPHIWAVPLLLLLGVALGWWLRSQLDRKPSGR